MIIKFKNGYRVQITDCEGKSKAEVLQIARDAVKQIENEKCSQKDASLGRAQNTNVSFSLQRMREAIKNNDIPALDIEIDFLNRDLDADASAEHKNYVKTFRPELLKKIVDQYEKAIELVRKVDEDAAQKLAWKLWPIKENWNLTGAKFVAHAKVDNEKEEVSFESLEDARRYLNVLTKKAAQEGKTINSRYVYNDLTGEVIDNTSWVGDSVDLPEDIEKTYLVMVSIANGMMYIATDGYTPRQKNARRFIYEKDAYEAGKATGLNFKIIAEDKKEVTDAKVKDVPYFDPTENPVIESDYSTERLKKELAHPEKGKQNLEEFHSIIDEINEFIEKGSQALIDAGWSKIDARHAIAMKYYPLVKELRAAKRNDLAGQLKSKIKELEKAWDLVR